MFSLFLIAARNLKRSWFRTIFTVLGAAIALMAFCMIRTIDWSWNAGIENAASVFVIVHGSSPSIAWGVGGPTQPSRFFSRDVMDQIWGFYFALAQREPPLSSLQEGRAGNACRK